MSKLGQEPAFPCEYENRDGSRQPIEGMSKRFYAACAAMQGIMVNYQLLQDGMRNAESKKGDGGKLVVALAYDIADELLKQEQNGTE